MKTLKQVNTVLKLLNELCDACEEPRIPVKYHFEHDIETWVIHNIFPEDKSRLENRLEYIYFCLLDDNYEEVKK